MAEILILRLLVLVGAVIAGYYLYKFVTAPEKEDKEEVRLLKQAIEVSKSREGRVTAADIAFSMDITLHDADKLLTKLAAEGLATAEVNDQGALEYDVPRARAETDQAKIRQLNKTRRRLGEM
jgi:hypothetical protein